MSRAPNRDRADIQGLRAVASLLVATYHVWFHRVSGGVDVFFVVSGFLITRSLVGRLGPDGRLDVAGFWAGLARRLLPTALMVIVATSLAAPWVLPRVLWASTAEDGLASLAYVANWRLAFEAVDYLARDRTPSPFQHFWALAVQGQFYLLWPILVLGASRLAAARGRTLKQMLTFTLAATFVVSFTYAAISTWRDQPFAYFDTVARLWEFALGGLVAASGGRLTARWSPLLGWMGLAGVVATGVLFPVSQVFPGPMTLWPTLSAVLILVAGASHEWGVDRVLGRGPLSQLGDHSYGFYLWHWPLLVGWWAWSGSFQVSLLAGLLLLTLAAALTWITTRTVGEFVRRHASGLAAGPVLRRAAATVAAVGILLGGQSGYARHLRRQEHQTLLRPDPLDYPGGRLGVRNASPTPDRLPLPGPFSLADDVPVSYVDGCHQSIKVSEPRVCTYGDPGGRITIALVGGSHAAHWLPALQQLAPELSLRILSITKSDCWLNDDLRPNTRTIRIAHSCAEWNRRVVDTLRDLAPDAVFTTSTVLDRADGTASSAETSRGEYVPPGYVAKWRQIASLGIDVLAVRDTPWHLSPPGECVDVFGAANPRCQRPRALVFARDDPSTQVEVVPLRFRRIDLTDRFCDEENCPPVVGHIQVYRDKHHLSATFAASLGPALAPHLRAWIDGRRPRDSQPGTAVAAGADRPVSVLDERPHRGNHALNGR